MMERKDGILIISFGTTYQETREKNIHRLTAEIQNDNPDAFVLEAFSSRIVRKVLLERDGLFIADTETAMKRMRYEGVTHLTVLPTHVIDGIENGLAREIIRKNSGWFREVRFADALLVHEEDYEIAARALWDSLKEEAGDAPVILMGHGTAHEADESYQKFERAIQNYSGHPVFVATVEGSITLEDKISQLKAVLPEGGKVLLTPFMLVAGDHANHDMAGENDSFASRLQKEGYEAECILRGIGEYPLIRGIYKEHLKKARLLSALTGTFCGIGVGPGDPELLTLKAVRMMRESDVILLPSAPKEECHAYRIALQAVPELEKKEIICRSFPMSRDPKILEQAHESIYQEVQELLNLGKQVAFLTIGDPTIYSTFSYIRNRVQQRGGHTKTVSGIPSFCAAAARLGISLGDGNEEIHIIPGSINPAETADYSGTRIFMKSGRRLAELKEELQKEITGPNGRNLQIYSVSNCGMENEKVGIGAGEILTDKGYLTLVIVRQIF